MQIGEIITVHEEAGYKEIYTGVDYFKIYAMDTSNHDFKYDFIITDTTCCHGNKELSPLRMLILVKQALNSYIYIAYDGYFDDFFDERPFHTKSISISAKVLFVMPRIGRADLFDKGIEGIYHFYTNTNNSSDNFVSDKWKKTSELDELRSIPYRLEKDVWTEETLKLLKEN